MSFQYCSSWIAVYCSHITRTRCPCINAFTDIWRPAFLTACNDNPVCISNESTNLLGEGDLETFLLGDFLGDRLALRLLLRLLFCTNKRKSWRLQCERILTDQQHVGLHDGLFRDQVHRQIKRGCLSAICSGLHSPAHTARPPGGTVTFWRCFGALLLPLLFLSIPVDQRQVKYPEKSAADKPQNLRCFHDSVAAFEYAAFFCVTFPLPCLKKSQSSR